ncbi:LL-diaminopimelate aminotransferase [Cerasicoccus arenae]|uniref:Aminotransferase n=1 Tax=Cerasicoccus arenae TaxID=424488 RepID=A0A8J3GDH4_9BACT|nr:LL-diaminopimelate aminotransferase [Cerasicoccus arenae]MBK1857666.1 LL-diaminopimelate aminotransferase [Cerasicoccus arenae]GHB91501.1 aspartate aminotransferase [Cerasicoccus arenae]
MADDTYIQQLFADRIGGAQYGKSTAIYKFEKIKRAKAAAKKDKPGIELIDMGVGEPDEMAYPEVVSALITEASKPENRGYADNGGPEFKEAVARHMKAVYDVQIDAATEVCHSIGSKAALSLIPACFINPDDYVLMTTPGYPVFGTHAKYYGGQVYNYPLTADNNFLPDLKSVPANILAKAKVLVINYPNNPTGASATKAFFEEVVAFAKENGLIVLQDAAYSALVFEGEKPLSILQVDGGKDVAIELHSLSKSYNMTGWRIGWVCGNPLIVKAYSDIKDNSDSGQFLAIQQAAAAALDNPGITEEIAAKYSRRMDMLVDALTDSGFTITKPKGSFFLYTAIPQSATTPEGAKVEFKTAEDFSQFLIRELLISTVPWDDAGAFVRFSVTFSAKGKDAEEKMVDEIKRRLDACSFEF